MDLKDVRNNHGWTPKGEIYDLAGEKTGTTGEHTGSRLQDSMKRNI
jgi:hypothetical protein